MDGVDVALANLRAGVRWAADHGDVDTAADIAAHTSPLAFALQRYEGGRDALYPSRLRQANTAATLAYLAAAIEKAFRMSQPFCMGQQPAGEHHLGQRPRRSGGSRTSPGRTSWTVNARHGLFAANRWTP